ncbi:MAG: tyrosine-type recombinase/integrase [Gammaproteobacteria bacterium]|nr:tyrosine-type recombinase/integrase [Gammaproteobacteria bacterium]
MSPLRKRMIQDMQLRGLSSKTQDGYVRAVKQLAVYYGKSPDQITSEELRHYFLYLKNEKQVSRSGFQVALCGIKFFYEKTLGQTWQLFELIRPAREKKLPVVLSQEEVYAILEQVHQPGYRTCLTLLYACGLRLKECVWLELRAIDSLRMMLHVRSGKGKKDRYVPLPKPALLQLRAHWATHQHPQWLFPTKPKRGILQKEATAPCHTSTLQKAFKKALHASGVNKCATPHTLRHSYATHLLENGVNIRLIQTWLGHRSLQSTMLYTHLTRKAEAVASDIIEQLMADLPG